MDSASSLPALGFLSLYDKQTLDSTNHGTHHDATWITYRFEYKRPPSSCEGEPAPNRALFGESPEFTNPFAVPNGDFIELPGGGSTGELAPVEGPDWGL